MMFLYAFIAIGFLSAFALGRVLRQAAADARDQQDDEIQDATRAA